MRRKIVAGNWKMNINFGEADDLISGILQEIEENGIPANVDAVVCPPALYLELATDMASGKSLFIGAQNVSEHEQGAYTGEISAGMLESVETDYCIIGHSERRKYFHESDSELANKTNSLLKNNIKPIFCCGELLEDREDDLHMEVVSTQLTEGLFHLEEEDFKKVVLAYEPVWAIGTGKTASPEQAQEMHAFIRALVAKKYNKEIADECIILYGGSCNAANAEELFSQPDVDGGLIGGASLKVDDFLSILRSA
ncbi:MAG: triose-phosphate isomerase [Bacteroidetes bacterium]|nr:MAG: triose-phosphate isomerase [Bacteroidota bacterium]